MKILDASYTTDYQTGSPTMHLWGVGGRHLMYSDHTAYFFLEFNDHITHDVGMKLLQAKGFYMVKAVAKFRPIGYQDKPRGMFQVFCRSPKDVREARKVAARIPNIFKIYNADIKYKNVWMIDHDTGGMAEFGPVDDSPMKYLGFDIEVLVSDNGKFPVAEEDPIILISLSFSPKYSEVDRIVLTTKPTTYEGCHIIKCEDERDLLSTFIFLINDFNPDIIAGYNSNSFDFPYINKRCIKLGVKPNVTRDNRTWYIRPRFDGGIDVSITGRVVVDLLPIICKNYSLNQYTLREVAKLVKYEKLDMSPKEMREAYISGENWDKVIAYSARDAELVMKLMLDLKIIDKYVALSKASGLLLQDVINSRQTQMIEAMLLRKFKDANRVMNMRPEMEEDEDEVKYEGATVLEPPTQMQENLVILDYSALYPSIIRAHNISYDTIILQDDEDLPHEVSPSGAKFVKSSVHKGILPETLAELYNKRVETRKKMKAAVGQERDFLDAQQYAYKILMNSYYGYAGYVRARLFTIQIAESVTAWGRTNIEDTIGFVQNELKYKVVYGDTDSIFVECKLGTDLNQTQKLDEMKKIGENIAKLATARLPAPMSLAFEAICIRAIFLAKKHYSMWRFELDGDGWSSKIKSKGIATVRRDWAPITGKTISKCLEMILIEDNVTGAAQYVHNIIVDLKHIDISKSTDRVDDLLLTKRYGGDIAKYKNKPVHIKLIERMIARGEPEPATGDRIPFIIINEYSGTFSDKGETVEYAMKKGYTLDVEYYLNKQLLSPISDLFAPFGITANILEKGILKREDTNSKQQSLFDWE